jgi:hypothetical protein
MRLSDPEMRPTLEALRERVQTDPAFAKKLLQGAGIVDATGKLTKNFGG